MGTTGNASIFALKHNAKCKIRATLQNQHSEHGENHWFGPRFTYEARGTPPSRFVDIPCGLLMVLKVSLSDVHGDPTERWESFPSEESGNHEVGNRNDPAGNGTRNHQ